MHSAPLAHDRVQAAPPQWSLQVEPDSHAKVHAAPSQTKLQVAPARHVKVQAAPLHVGAQVEPFSHVTVEPAPQAVVHTPVHAHAPPADTDVPHPLPASSLPLSASPPTSQS